MDHDTLFPKVASCCFDCGTYLYVVNGPMNNFETNFEEKMNS